MQIYHEFIYTHNYRHELTRQIMQQFNHARGSHARHSLYAHSNTNYQMAKSEHHALMTRLDQAITGSIINQFPGVLVFACKSDNQFNNMSSDHRLQVIGYGQSMMFSDPLIDGEPTIFALRAPQPKVSLDDEQCQSLTRAFNQGVHLSETTVREIELKDLDHFIPWLSWTYAASFHMGILTLKTVHVQYFNKFRPISADTSDIMLLHSPHSFSKYCLRSSLYDDFRRKVDQTHLEKKNYHRCVQV